MSSVEKALQILLLLAREQSPLGVREIGRRLDLSAPTVHRLLSTMSEYDLVQQISDGSDYQLSWACLTLGRAVLSGTEVAQVAPKFVQRLRDATEETVTAQVRSGGEQVVVVEAEGLHQLRRRVGIGRRMPLHAGASGCAILAFLTPDDIDRYTTKSLADIGPNTITDPAILRERLTDIRRLGYAVSHQETVFGVAAASVPIFGEDGSVAGSMSVSGPEPRISADLETRIVPLLVDAGAELSRALGHRIGEADTSLVHSHS